MKEFVLILRTIFRNKIGAFLVSLQLAVTLTIVVNEYTAITEQLEQANRDSGFRTEEDLFAIRSSGYADDYDSNVAVQEDLRLIRSTSGVVNAYATNAVPMSSSGWNHNIATDTNADAIRANAAVYFVDEHAFETLDIVLLYGENFSDTDVLTDERSASKTIVSKELAETLFPSIELPNVVGKVVYAWGDTPKTIIGILEKMHAPWNGEYIVFKTILYPQIPQGASSHYVVRTAPSHRDEVMQTLTQTLADTNSDRVIDSARTFSELRKSVYDGQRVLTWILSLTMVILLIITGCGIVGLASFTVQRRTKQIGTRRALGATVGDIAAFHFIEYSVMCVFGLTIGIAMAVGLNIYFVDQAEFPALQFSHVVIGVVLTYLVAMLGVTVPAIRGAKIDPAIALRAE